MLKLRIMVAACWVLSPIARLIERLEFKTHRLEIEFWSGAAMDKARGKKC